MQLIFFKTLSSDAERTRVSSPRPQCPHFLEAGGMRLTCWWRRSGNEPWDYLGGAFSNMWTAGPRVLKQKCAWSVYGNKKAIKARAEQHGGTGEVAEEVRGGSTTGSHEKLWSLWGLAFSSHWAGESLEAAMQMTDWCWRVSKYVWNHLGTQIHFFNCQFDEI